MIVLQRLYFPKARDDLLRAQRLAGGDTLVVKALLWEAGVMAGEQAPLPPDLAALDAGGAKADRKLALAFGVTRCTLGWRQLLGGQPRPAIADFEAAVAMSDRLPSYPFLGLWCMSGLGRALLAAGDLAR